MLTDHMFIHPDSLLHGGGAGNETIDLVVIWQEYTKGGLKEGDLPDNPPSLFNRWLHEAIDIQAEESVAMFVGTVSPEGRPSTYAVLLKGLHDRRFIFCINCESRKGSYLVRNPYTSPSFVWHVLKRRIHIGGVSPKAPAGESDVYFHQRPYKSHIGVCISSQSRPLKNRMQLIHSFVAEVVRWVGREVERPVY